jgi:hypothetical protein
MQASPSVRTRRNSNLQANFVILMFVQEAGHLLLECTCLQKFSHGAGIAEKLPLEFCGESVPLHDNRSSEAPKNVCFLLSHGEGASHLLPVNRLVQIVRHPVCVIGKLGEAAFESLELPDFIRLVRGFDQFRVFIRAFSVLPGRKHLVTPLSLAGRNRTLPPPRTLYVGLARPNIEG